MEDELVVIQGGGDLASGVAHKLFRSGMRVIILEIPSPLAVRRTVSFAQAVLDMETEVEGVQAIFVKEPTDIRPALTAQMIPVCTASLSRVLDIFQPRVLVNATLSKRNIGMRKDLAPLTIALGPGYIAGEDVDVVVETQRGHYLGQLIYEGMAAANTGVPGVVMGCGAERVLRAPEDGSLCHVQDIGTYVTKNEVICMVNGEAVSAPFDGIVRGLIMNGCQVQKGDKIGDVDPRGREDYCYTVSDKARSVGGAVLEAILHDRLSAKE